MAMAARVRHRAARALALGIAAGIAALAPAAPAAAAELSGRLELTGRGARGADLSAAVVTYEPAAGVRAPAARTVTIETRDKAFTPRFVAVPRGSRVRFPNRDRILHNVFSVSRGNAFDLGLVGEGPGVETVLEQPGLVRIFCNVHHGMVAYVLVVETPHYAALDAAGRFRLTGLPAGRGTLTVWHEQTEPVRLEVTVPAAGPVAVEAEVARPRVPLHLNKLGKSYGRARDRY